ncbi:SAVED domain-containing protein [Methylomusa anaerophila]|nr:SAVED domain-containing protein [Methylomusa anaerophila]
MFFISYSHEDDKDTKNIQQLDHVLKAYGLKTWIDQKNLPAGRMEQNIKKIIECERVEGYVLYVSQHSLRSHPVCEWELKPALKKRDHDPNFIMFFVLEGITFEEFKELSWRKFGVDLTQYYYQRIEEGNRLQTYHSVAQKLLDSKLQQVTEPLSEWVLNLYARGEDPKTSNKQPHLQIDLSYFFAERIPQQQEWEEIIIPAWQGIKRKIAGCPGRIHLQSNVLLPTGIAFGRVFHAATKYCLTFSDQEGWQTEGSVKDKAPLRQESHRGREDSDNIILEVGIAQDTRKATNDYVEKHHLDYRAWHSLKAEECSRNFIASPQHAYDTMTQIAEKIRKCSSEYPGNILIHLFYAGPLALAFMIGHCLNAVGPIQLYEFHKGLQQYEQGLLLKMND